MTDDAPARFISIEGGEGAGKSTQARLLAGALERRGISVVMTREPGGTPGAEALRSLLLDNAYDWNARSEALLFAAARADHVAHLIRPALDEGRWVISDRFLDSSRAYQGGNDGLSDEDIVSLHRIGSGALLPDLTIWLSLDPDEGALRAKRRDGDSSDRIGGRNAGYHRQVDAAFASFAEAEPHRVRRVDAAGSPEEVHARILDTIAELLP